MMKDYLSNYMFIDNGYIMSLVGDGIMCTKCDVSGSYQLNAEKVKELYKLKMNYYAYTEQDSKVYLNAIEIGKPCEPSKVYKPIGMQYNIDCSPLKDMVKFAPKKDKPESLRRLCINVLNNEVSFVITDGAQLIISKQQEKGKEIYISIDSVKYLIKMNPDLMTIDTDKVTFFKGAYEYTINYAETGFPDYRRIIPSKTLSETFNKSFIETLINQEKLSAIDHKYDDNYKSRVILHIDTETCNLDYLLLQKVINLHKDKQITLSTDGKVLVYEGRYLILTACLMKL